MELIGYSISRICTNGSILSIGEYIFTTENWVKFLGALQCEG